MIHVLVGAANELDDLLKTAKNSKPVEWRVPKRSHANDRALFYFPSHGFTARGMIVTEPREYEIGRYGANVRDVLLLASVVPLAFIHKNYPSWKWLNAKMKSYTTIDGKIEARLEELINQYQTSFAEPLPLTEGTSKSVAVIKYERSPVARQQCIAHYGTSCYVCGFSFGHAYGETAGGYIHVHHLEAISSRSGKRTVDPIKDLRPICPNCHAVAHLQVPPLSIQALRRMLKASRD